MSEQPITPAPAAAPAPPAADLSEAIKVMNDLASPPAPAPAAPATEESTDWKAMARQWEKRAKENSAAQAELEKLRTAAMTEQERAVSEAETRGRTAAAADYGTRLAAAEFRAAAAAAGVQLGDAADLIDTSRFATADGTVDSDAIKAAVTKLAALAPRTAGRSGIDHGASGGEQPASLQAQIDQAKAKGDWRGAMRLETSKLSALIQQ